MHRISGNQVFQDQGVALAVQLSTHRGTDMPMHTHDFHELVYVRHGGGIHRIDNRPYPIIAGDFYVMRPGEPHAYDVERGELRIYNILLRPTLFTSVDWTTLVALPGLAPLFAGATGQRHKVTLPPPHDHAVETLCERIRDEMMRRTSGYRLLGRALALEMLLTINRVAMDHADGPAAGPIATAVAYLHAHPEQTMAMADLAAETGLSPNYLGERFKAELGVTVADYLNRLRVDRARELLAGTDRSVTDIADAVGFTSISYFGKVFGKLTGQTPRAYRAVVRGG